jgi:hypothetical protein
MKIVFQPGGSNLCGQACVAMVARCGLETSVRKGFKGHRGKSSWLRVRWALYRLKIKSWSKILRGAPDKKAICRMRFAHNPNQSHFVVFDGKKFHDPDRGTFEKNDPSFLNLPHSRISTYLLVK